MNGRIYDADLGRFMQADPIIQAPGNAQSWNAYSYVLNNPLRYTDSTGMEIDQGIREALGIIIAAVYMYFTVDPNGAMSLYGAIAIGFVSGYVATGTFKGGVQGALIAGLTFGIGVAGANWDDLARVGAQAMAGGITQYLQGGNFGSGFLAAGLTAAFMPQVGHLNNDLARTAVGALVGGTGYIFNQYDMWGDMRTGYNAGLSVYSFSSSGSDFFDFARYQSMQKSAWGAAVPLCAASTGGC